MEPLSPFPPLKPFPEEKAEKILEYAKKLGAHAVKEIIDTIRDLFGHPEAIRDRVNAWGYQAKTGIAQSVESITASRSDLTAYWEGGAFDSYKLYVDHLEEVFDNARNVFGQMADHLQAMAEAMTNFYNRLLTYVNHCYATIISCTGGILATIKEALIGIAEPIADAIAKFVEDSNDVITEMNMTIYQYNAAGQDIKQSIADLKVPETIPSSSVDPGGWKVRAR